MTYYPFYPALSGLHADPDRELELIEATITNKGLQLLPDQKETLLNQMATQRIACELKTLEEVIVEESLDRIDLLKIDVEHSEWDVLVGVGDKHWPRIQQLVLEVHDEDGRLKKIMTFLHSKGFESWSSQRSEFAGTSVHMVYAIRPPVRSKTSVSGVGKAPQTQTRKPSLTSQAMRSELYGRSPLESIEPNLWPSPYDYVLEDRFLPKTVAIGKTWALMPCQLPKNTYHNPGFTLAGRRLIQSLFQAEGHPFDFRTIIFPFRPYLLLSQQTLVLEVQPGSTAQAEEVFQLSPGQLDGFAWFPLNEKHKPDFTAWATSPVFLPLATPGIAMPSGGIVRVNLSVNAGEDGRHATIEFSAQIQTEGRVQSVFRSNGAFGEPHHSSPFSRKFLTMPPVELLNPPAQLSNQVVQFLSQV